VTLHLENLQTVLGVLQFFFLFLEFLLEYDYILMQLCFWRSLHQLMPETVAVAVADSD
jgi:hypothetical protein